MQSMTEKAQNIPNRLLWQADLILNVGTYEFVLQLAVYGWNERESVL